MVSTFTSADYGYAVGKCFEEYVAGGLDISWVNVEIGDRVEGADVIAATSEAKGVSTAEGGGELKKRGRISLPDDNRHDVGAYSGRKGGVGADYAIDAFAFEVGSDVEEHALAVGYAKFGAQ